MPSLQLFPKRDKRRVQAPHEEWWLAQVHLRIDDEYGHDSALALGRRSHQQATVVTDTQVGRTREPHELRASHSGI